MVRFFALAASLLMASGVAISAQHPAHPPGHPHDGSGHAPMDPAQHAALHALMHGNWRGEMSSPGGASNIVDLNVVRDESGNVTFRMAADRSGHFGASSQLAIDGHTVRWTQEVSGTPCRSVASITAATAKEPETLKGTMACAHGQMTFALHRINK